MTDDHVDTFPSEEDAGCIADIPGLAHEAVKQRLRVHRSQAVDTTFTYM